jgi:hypothetical protein
MKRLPTLLIGGTLAVLMATAMMGFAPAVRARLGWAPVERPAYSVGDEIDLPARFRDRAERTLVVFGSGTCGASIRSTPALTKLAKDVRGSSTAFLLVTPDTMKSDQKTLEIALGLTATEHVALDLSALKVRSVPTVVLVDRSGRVLFTREGYIDDAGHDILLNVARDKQS